MRPTTNTQGNAIASCETSLASFWSWFGGSAAVNSWGSPLVLYHGTRNRFDEFSAGFGNEEDTSSRIFALIQWLAELMRLDLKASSFQFT